MSKVQEIRLAALKNSLATSVRDLDEGRFQTYSDASLMKLADEIGRTGRIRLNGRRLKVVAKVHGKKNL